MQLRIAHILRVIFIDSRRNSSGTEGGRSFIFVADTSRFCRVFRAESCCGFHHAGRVTVCFRTKSCGYIVRYFYGLSTLVVQADCACRSRAAFSSGGSSLPRLEALCRIPRQAFGLKQYFSGAFAIKICDKEDAFSSLGDSPVLCVKHSPGDGETVCQYLSCVCPFFTSRNRNGFVLDPAQAFKDCSEVLAFVGTERSVDVFPDRKSRIFAIGRTPHFFYNSDRLIEQARPRTVKTAAFSGNAHVLTRAAECDYIHRRQISTVQRRYISIVLHLR